MKNLVDGIFAFGVCLITLKITHDDSIRFIISGFISLLSGICGAITSFMLRRWYDKRKK